MVKTIYRGDGDYKDERDLKSLLQRGMIKNNLVCGGIGREIFEKPLIYNIKNHINEKWKKTHFLSFTEDIDRAVIFGKGVNNLDSEYEDYYEDDGQWDFVILKFDTNKLFNIQEVGIGIFKAQYTPSLIEFKPTFNIFMIDVVKTLQGSSLVSDADRNAIMNAERDKEWLILPANIKDFGLSVEFSGLLDCELFSEINKFKII